MTSQGETEHGTSSEDPDHETPSQIDHRWRFHARRPEPADVELDLLQPEARAEALAEVRTSYLWHWTDRSVYATAWQAERRHAVTAQVGWQQRKPRPAVRVWVKSADRLTDRGGRVERVTDSELSYAYSLTPDEALRRVVEKIDHRRERLVTQLESLDEQLRDIATYRLAECVGRLRGRAVAGWRQARHGAGDSRPVIRR